MPKKIALVKLGVPQVSIVGPMSDHIGNLRKKTTKIIINVDQYGWELTPKDQISPFKSPWRPFQEIFQIYGGEKLAVILPDSHLTIPSQLCK